MRVAACTSVAGCAVASSPPRSPAGSREAVLLASVFAVAVAGLIYELVAGTLSTYLLGGSVVVFSLVIGVFLFAMGMGAFAAQWLHSELERRFVEAELLLGVVGGSSALGLFWAFGALGEGYTIALGLTCLVVGALVGVEIPLLLRILERRVEVRLAVSQVLALDYAGALAGSILFPLVLLPWLGAVRAAALVGLLNVGVAGLGIAWLGDHIRGRNRLAVASVVAALGLSGVLLTGARTTTWIEDQLYQDSVVHAESTRYQRIVVTRWREDLRLYLDGHLQFSSVDEYRYHESLVHPAMQAAGSARRVLILGGGDGMAAREVLKHPEVRQIDLVDLDPVLTELFREQPELAALSGHALSDPRVTVHNDDALRFLEDAEARWDVVIMDLPDPNDSGLSRLYSEAAFRLAGRRLTDQGALVTQATSPFYAPEAFWCIARTAEAALSEGPQPRTIRPYHVHVPSFGEWGFVLASHGEVSPEALVPEVPTRFLDESAVQAMVRFPADLGPRDVVINRLEDAALARYYAQGWRHYRQ
ncbi:MAG: polyamine aminopropyltransferase [Deltaproteobacteria bacterium]|nr:MAG: polyamine aminopropyltransferase [Deltaproteobacteria bacterium]